MRFKELRSFMGLLILITITILLVSFLWKYNLILIIALGLESIILLIVFHKKHDIIYFIVGGICGPAAEMVAVHFGAWNFANSNFYNIPLWLPLLWGIVLVSMKKATESLINTFKKTSSK